MMENEIIGKLDNIIALLSKSNSWLQNLLSTVIGVILGTVLTLINQKSGSLKCYIVSYTTRFNKVIAHLPEEVNVDDDPESCEIKIAVDFQNTMQHAIGLRDVFLEIYHGKEDYEQYTLKDNETRRPGNCGIYYDELNVINIESNCVKRKDLLVWLDKNQVKQLQL